ncbi:MAG: T9SS type A sorting domain-containing protein, partial [candidate division WOR-3 bacterium]
TLGGITFCSRDSLFYISDLFGRKAWSFNPLNPNGALTQRFAFQDIFGDGFYDGDGPGNARKDAGELHIVLGSPSLSGSYDLATWPHPVIYGADTGDWLSRHCSGDVNGDGFDDILANASRSASLGNARPSAGEIYLILGRASWPSSLDMAAGDYRCVFYGAESGDWMDVSAIGDATGDGAPDIIVGGVMADGPGNGRPNCGELNLFRWSNSLPSVIDLLTDTPLVYIYAPQAYDTMGIYSACLVGDPDANGRPNIIVGAAKSTRLGLSGNGQVFVLSYPLELAADESAGGSERFTLIPRPGGFRLVLPEGYSGQVSVYDASGRQIASETVSESWEISLSSGVYLVRAQGLGTGKIAVR